MIIVVCNDDPRVGQLAVQTSQGNPGVFGQAVMYNNPGQLADGDDLYLIGHGVKADPRGNPSIGDLALNGLSFNAVELYDYLRARGVFANWTRGRVFILCCESLEHDYDSFSFAEVFYAQVAPNRTVKVFGRHVNGFVIPPPGDPSYVQVIF